MENRNKKRKWKEGTATTEPLMPNEPVPIPAFSFVRLCLSFVSFVLNESPVFASFKSGNKKALPDPIGLLDESGKPYAGMTLTTFLLSGPFTAKVTLPSILANRV